MIKLKTLTVKNFMSVGNVTQALNFEGHELTLVLGQNIDLGGDDAGSRNGTGKTTILNALSFALFRVLFCVIASRWVSSCALCVPPLFSVLVRVSKSWARPRVRRVWCDASRLQLATENCRTSRSRPSPQLRTVEHRRGGVC